MLRHARNLPAYQDLIRNLQGIRNVRHAIKLGSCKKVGVMQEGKVGIKPVRLGEIQAEIAHSSSQ